jgi:hypothetical protein
MSGDEIGIVIVPDDYGTCPRCGAFWGNPDKALDWPNRQKVDNLWKCYNPACSADYFDPERFVVVSEVLTAKELAEQEVRVKAQVDAMTAGKKWKEVRPNTFVLVPDDSE